MKKIVYSLILACGFAVTGISAQIDDVLCKNDKKPEFHFRKACKADEIKADMREADEAMVVGCTYLSDVQASSAWGGLAAREKGMSNARKSVIEKAAAKGATHVVWSHLQGGFVGASSSAKVYKCDQ
jgi:hypothetical protein